jgi:hypothetical protein
VHKARLVAPSIGLGELVLVECADPPQQVELVLQMCPHHLWPVCRDRELDSVLHERTERVPDVLLVRLRLRQQVRRGTDLQHDARIAQRGHQLRIVRRQDAMADPVRV